MYLFVYFQITQDLIPLILWREWMTTGDTSKRWVQGISHSSSVMSGTPSFFRQWTCVFNQLKALLVSQIWSSSVVMSGFLYIQCYVSDVELYHWDGGQDKESPGRSPGAESPGPRGAVPVDAQTRWGDGRWYEEAIQRPDGSHPQTDRGPRLRCPQEGRYRKL